MYLKGIAFSPHPPIIIPEVGRGEEKRAGDTIDGMEKLSKAVASKKPETIVFITPHGNVFSDAVCVADENFIKGDFGKFSRPDVSFEKRIDRELMDKIRDQFAIDGISNIFMDRKKAQRYMVDVEIDHGCAVPLYYIEKRYGDFEMIHISIGMISIMDMYKAGMSLGRAIEKSKKDTVIVASGDLSHRLSSEGPYTYSPKGIEFDRTIVDALEKGDFKRAVSIPESIYEPAGECGYRSIAMALGAIDSLKSSIDIYSYEGPFGVGYMTGFADVSGEKKDSLIQKLEKERAEEMYGTRDEYVRLARLSVQRWVRERVKVDPESAGRILGIDVEKMKKEKAGAFVCIHREGELRGCIGTTGPTSDNVAQEIINNAISATSNDPRFFPVEPYELENLEIKVDILGELEKVDSTDMLDEKEYGVLVESGLKRGVLLPDLEGVNSVQRQVEIAKSKAGIGDDEDFKIYRFKVERHS